MRLWPASWPWRPKQFIDVIGKLSLFQGMVQWEAPFATDGRLEIVAGAAQQGFVETQLSALGGEADLVLEPTARDSAPAITAAALWIERIDPDATAIFVASDHHIPDAVASRNTVGEAIETAAAGRILILGLTSDGPSSA